jgi:LAO/AO transport system kinase
VIDQGHRVAVLAVDPSSARSGGSILGDKTRMESLARAPDAYIRPSPSSGAVGGVARRTREAMLVCESAGFDVVLVETVGVGQSDTAVADMVDVFVVLVAPGGGDELQGIKRGLMELADVVAVTKADGDLASTANQTVADYRHALHLLRPKRSGWEPRVVLSSALRGDGIDTIWDAVIDQRESLDATESLARLRSDQAVAWFWNEVREHVLDELTSGAMMQARVHELESAVAAGDLSPAAAAMRLLAER